MSYELKKIGVCCTDIMVENFPIKMQCIFSIILLKNYNLHSQGYEVTLVLSIKPCGSKPMSQKTPPPI